MIGQQIPTRKHETKKRPNEDTLAAQTERPEHGEQQEAEKTRDHGDCPAGGQKPFLVRYSSKATRTTSDFAGDGRIDLTCDSSAARRASGRWKDSLGCVCLLGVTVACTFFFLLDAIVPHFNAMQALGKLSHSYHKSIVCQQFELFWKNFQTGIAPCWNTV